MLPLNLLLVLAITTFSAAAPLPNPKAAITLSHTSTSTGESTSGVIDPSWFGAKLAKVVSGLGNDLNIHINGARSRGKRSHALSGHTRLNPLKRFIAKIAPRDDALAAPAAPVPTSSSGIKDSTINLTVISKRRAYVLARRAAVKAAKDATDAATPHHNVLIDASGAEPGAGGIQNSVINVHFNSKDKRGPKIVAGEHSVVVNPAGIEGSTVHVNILPGRASVGDHSIIIDSSSSTAGDDDETTAGDHSAVVSSHINSSTINLTVVKAKDVPVVEKRSEAWEQQVKAMTFPVNEDDFPVPPPAARWVGTGAESHASHGVARSA